MSMKHNSVLLIKIFTALIEIAVSTVLSGITNDWCVVFTGCVFYFYWMQ